MFKSTLVLTPEMKILADKMMSMKSPWKVSMGDKATLEEMQKYNQLVVEYNSLLPFNKMGSRKVSFLI